jgi:Tfp pilus assembly protein PilF
MFRRIGYFVALLAALSAVAMPRVAAADQKPWLEVRSPHFRVLTDGSARDGRRVAYELEEMRYVIATQFPTYRLESGAPLVVFAPRDIISARDLDWNMREKDGDNIGGEFNHTGDKQYAMVRLDLEDQGEDIVFHEYTHSILDTNVRWLPMWLDEGIAELYAYTQFQAHRIEIGAPSQMRYDSLTTALPIPIETLIQMTRVSNDVSIYTKFYAESWALVHFLTFGDGMQSGKRLNQFFDLMQQGVDQKKAFQQVFGSFHKMDAALDYYMSRMTYPVGYINPPPNMDQGSFPSRTMSVAETEAELSSYKLWTGDVAGARPLADNALKDDPKLGLAHEDDGFLLFADGKKAAAADEFSQAYALDPNLYLSLFAKTMLSPGAASDDPRQQSSFYLALVKVTHINPQFAPADVELARLSTRQDDLRSALQYSLKAEELEPSRAGYHLLTGQILLRAGHGDQAAAYAQYVAPRWFAADRSEAVELWNAVPAAQRPAGVSLSEDAPADTQRVEGTITSMVCPDQKEWDRPKDWKKLNLAIALNHYGQTITFHIKGEFGGSISDTLWFGQYRFDVCRNFEGLRAIVHYRAPSDPSYSGDVDEIDIRDDLTPEETNATPRTTPATAPSASATSH